MGEGEGVVTRCPQSCGRCPRRPSRAQPRPFSPPCRIRRPSRRVTAVDLGLPAVRAARGDRAAGRSSGGRTGGQVDIGGDPHALALGITLHDRCSRLARHPGWRAVQGGLRGGVGLRWPREHTQARGQQRERWLVGVVMASAPPPLGRAGVAARGPAAPIIGRRSYAQPKRRPRSLAAILAFSSAGRRAARCPRSGARRACSPSASHRSRSRCVRPGRRPSSAACSGSRAWNSGIDLAREQLEARADVRVGRARRPG